MFVKPTGVPFAIEEESVINGILTIDRGSVSERLKKVGNKPVYFESKFSSALFYKNS